MGFDAVLALFVEDTFEWDSRAAGILFLALFLPGFVAPLVGYLADKYGAKYLALAGFVTTIPILICLRFVTNASINDKVLLSFLLVVLGTALTFSNVPLMAEMTYAIHDQAAKHPDIFDERSMYGFGYGMFTMAFALGGVIGPLWAGYVVASAGWGTSESTFYDGSSPLLSSSLRHAVWVSRLTICSHSGLELCNLHRLGSGGHISVDRSWQAAQS
jgi:nitrate/nitrite transporter NarK